MSLRSPGMAVLDTDAQHLDLYCFAQRTRELPEKFETAIGPPLNIRTVQLRVLVAIPNDRYDAIVYIVEQLARHIPSGALVAIEGYAYGLTSTSVSVLCELGGHFRARLRTMGVQWKDVAATSAKKAFTGSGKSTKEDMVAKFKSFGFPELETNLRCTPSQNPYHDIVDAVAVMSTLIPKDSPTRPASKTKQKKTKIVRLATPKRRAKRKRDQVE